MAHLRLAIVTPRFWPLVGDGPSHLLQLAESMLDLGHHPTIVTPRWQRSWPERMVIGRLPLVRLRGSARGGWSTLRWMYTLGSWLRDARPEAVLVAGLKQEAYVTLGTAKTTHVPAILVAAEGDLAWQQTATLGARVAARCREARAIVATGDQLAHNLAAAGFAANCITLIPRTTATSPPCSPRLREDARNALAGVNYDLVTTANSQVALAVGRLDNTHHFDDLVRAWRIVTARRSEAKLWIVGDGPERDRLFRQISDLDQRFRVMLPGTFDCLDELLSASDMLLVAAPHDTPPLALLQAQAAGLPVIAAAGAAARTHVTHEQSGLLYPPQDIKSLATAVVRLIERPSEAVAYGAAARAAAQSRSTPHDEAQAYLRLIEQARQ